MAQSIRTYAAAGAAFAVAGAIAVAPVPSESLPDRALRLASPAMHLTTTADPFLVWAQVFDTTEVNFATLTDDYLEAPFPVKQQVIVNWYNYFQMLPDIGGIFESIVENADALIENQTAAQPDNLDVLHSLVFGLLEGEVPDFLKPVLDYTTNYNSGMVIGALGLMVSPMLALSDQIHEFVDELVDFNLGNAANALANIPAAMTNGFFNGHGILDLTFLAPLIPLPDGVTVDELGIAMGGLFSPAGSIFNSLNAEVDYNGAPITVAGVKAGLLGSWVAANKSSAEAIGWDGNGNPLGALPTEAEEAEEAEDAAEVEEAPAAASTADDEGEAVEDEGDDATAELVSLEDEGDAVEDEGEATDGDEAVEEAVQAAEEEAEEAVEAAEEAVEGADETGTDDTDADADDADGDDSGSDDSGSDDSEGEAAA